MRSRNGERQAYATELRQLAQWGERTADVRDRAPRPRSWSSPLPPSMVPVPPPQTPLPPSMVRVRVPPTPPPRSIVPAAPARTAQRSVPPKAVDVPVDVEELSPDEEALRIPRPGAVRWLGRALIWLMLIGGGVFAGQRLPPQAVDRARGGALAVVARVRSALAATASPVPQTAAVPRSTVIASTPARPREPVTPSAPIEVGIPAVPVSALPVARPLPVFAPRPVARAPVVATAVAAPPAALAPPATVAESPKPAATVAELPKPAATVAELPKPTTPPPSPPPPAATPAAPVVHAAPAPAPGSLEDLIRREVEAESKKKGH
jgi:hypothetical protein